jgi:hypothetical protein
MSERHCIGEPEEDLWPLCYSLFAVAFLSVGFWAVIWLAIELLLWSIQ